LGHSGVVSFGGIRIGGVSGIYNPHHYDQGYFERFPFNESTKKSAYHMRKFEVEKLKLVTLN